MAEEQAKKPAGAAGAAKADAKPAAKKEKPPALEDKPFREFMEQHYLPALKADLGDRGVGDLQLALTCEPMPIAGMAGAGDIWQAIGRWNGGDREFRIYFPKEDINGSKGFSCTEKGAATSTLESFMIDERKVNLDLMVVCLVKRLRAQKWIERN